MGLLISPPAQNLALVAPIDQEPFHPQTTEEPPHTRDRNLDVVPTLEVVGDLQQVEVEVPAQIHDSGDHFYLVALGQ